jgi:hypothetical protein
MHDLACLCLPQEIFTLKGHQGSQTPGITDTRLLRLFLVKSHFLPKNNGLRYLRATMKFPG